MKTLLSFLFLLYAISLSAQNTYKYDNAGNRTGRVINLTRSADSTSEITSLEDFISNHEVKIYPNPTKGMLAVDIANFLSGNEVEFQLTDMLGKTLYNLKTTSGHQTFDLSNEADGIYLLRIKINGESTTWKIIKK